MRACTPQARPPWRRRRRRWHPAGSTHCFGDELENVFFLAPADRLSLARSTMFSSTTLSFEQPQRPFARPRGGAEQAKAISLASFLPSKIRCPGEVGPMLARQCPLRASSTNCWRRPAHRGEAGFQRLHDLAVASILHPRWTYRLQQDTRLIQKLRGALAGADQFRQMPAFAPVSFTTYFFTLISLAARIASGN